MAPAPGLCHSPEVLGRGGLGWARSTVPGVSDPRPEAIVLCSLTEEYTLLLCLLWIGANLDEGHDAFCFCQGQTC